MGFLTIKFLQKNCKNAISYLNKTQGAWVLRRPSYSKNSKRITNELQGTPRIQKIRKYLKRIQKIKKRIQKIPKIPKKFKLFKNNSKDSIILKDSKRI